MKTKFISFIFFMTGVMTAVHCTSEYPVNDNLIVNQPQIINQSLIFQNFIGKYQGHLMGIFPITFEIKNDNRPVLISDINGIIE